MTSSNDESSHFFTKGLKNSEMRNFDLAIKDFAERHRPTLRVALRLAKENNHCSDNLTRCP